MNYEECDNGDAEMGLLKKAISNRYTINELIEMESKRLPYDYMKTFNKKEIKLFHRTIHYFFISKNKKINSSKLMNMLINKCLDEWQYSRVRRF